MIVMCPTDVSALNIYIVLHSVARTIFPVYSSLRGGGRGRGSGREGGGGAYSLICPSSSLPP